MIKCPECGHQISDMANSCPNCGVAVKGNITKCPTCGTVYFSREPFCPACKATTMAPGGQPVNPNQPGGMSPQPGNGAPEPPKKSNKGLIASIIVALVILIGGAAYYITSANNPRGSEEEAYASAMESSDPSVLQDYLENYKDAPQEHIDSIQAHLKILQLNDAEWTNALLSNSKSMLKAYLEKHPESLHKAEAEHKIDSLDWAYSTKQNTVEAFEAYLAEHADGEHAVEAQEMMEKVGATTVNPDDKEFVNSVFKQFFNGINANDEMGITSVVSSTLNFLTNANATKSDVITFLHKLYKEDIKGMNWRPNSDYKISKNDAGDGAFEFDVEFTVDESVSNVDSSKDKFNQYKVKGHVDKNGKISSLQLVKIE